jgi:hypothetical protein
VSKNTTGKMPVPLKPAVPACSTYPLAVPKETAGGGRIYSKTRLRDRIDPIIVHEYNELHHGSHAAALKVAPKTELPVSDLAGRLRGAMAG